MRSFLPLLLAGCAHHLGIPQVDYRDPEPLPLLRMARDNRWYVPMEVEGQGTWAWFFDTGYSYSTCDDGLIAALGLPTRGRSPVRGEVGRLTVPKARLPDMELGGHGLEGVVCQVRDLNTTSSIRDPDGVRVAGVLGMDVIRPFRVTMDPSERHVLLEQPSRDRLDGDGVIRIKREYRIGIRALVPVGIGGQTVWPVLDTGASGTHLNGEKLGLVPTRVREGVVVRGTGSSGSTTRTIATYDVPDALLGPLEHGRLVFSGRSKGASAGLLGLNVLDRYRATYDFRGRRARFERVRLTERPTFTEWTHRHGVPRGSRLSAPPRSVERAPPDPR